MAVEGRGRERGRIVRIRDWPKKKEEEEGRKDNLAYLGLTLKRRGRGKERRRGIRRIRDWPQDEEEVEEEEG